MEIKEKYFIFACCRGRYMKVSKKTFELAKDRDDVKIEQVICDGVNNNYLNFVVKGK